MWFCFFVFMSFSEKRLSTPSILSKRSGGMDRSFTTRINFWLTNDIRQPYDKEPHASAPQSPNAGSFVKDSLRSTRTQMLRAAFGLHSVEFVEYMGADNAGQ